MSAFRGLGSRGFWSRTRAMLIKEFIQLRRDRVSFAMIVMIPLMQLVLFGYAINTTPRDLPTAVLVQENERHRPLDPRRAREHAVLQGHAPGPRRGGVRPAAGVRRGAVRDRDPGRLRARAAPRRAAGAADRRGRHRSGGGRLRARLARPAGGDRAARMTAPFPNGGAPVVRDPHACALQPGGRDPRSTSFRAWSAPSSR